MSRPILIYDGACPLCLRAKAWIEARTHGDAIRFVPCQDPARKELAPTIEKAACMEAMHFVDDSGRVYVGDKAFPPLLRAMGHYRWLVALLEMPGLRQAAPLVYGLVARNRHALSGLFRIKGKGDHCSVDSGCD